MNFYIGNSLSEININDENVEFNDELIDYIYDLKGHVPFNMEKFYEINPYIDVEISNKKIFELLKICKYILSLNLLDKYYDSTDAEKRIQQFIKLGESAMKKGIGLVSIGD